MKAVSANVVRGLPVGSQVPTCDNSGAKLVEIITVLGHKTVKGRRAAAGNASALIVTADARTNSIIINAPQQEFAQAKALIERLAAT